MRRFMIGCLLVIAAVVGTLFGLRHAARAQTASCPLPYCNSPNDPYSAYTLVTPPGVTPSSQVFCGKDTTHLIDPTTGLETLNDATWQSPMDTAGNCRSLWGASHWTNQAGANRRRATLVEIRGWLQDPPDTPPAPPAPAQLPYDDDGEQEKFLNVSLDVGWTPTPEVQSAVPAVVPINSLEKIAQYLPAFNISQFGGRLTPGPGGAWGGLSTAVVHVELNAWSKGRAYDTKNYLDYLNHIPSGWVLAGSFLGASYWNPACNISCCGPGLPQPPGNSCCVPPEHGTCPLTTYYAYLPFMPFTTDSNGALQAYKASDHITPPPLSTRDDPDPVAFYAGDYVRMVGLLWEDEPHTVDNHGAWNNGNDALPAKNCWDSNFYGQTRGWAEIHSVDFMTRLTPPGDPHLVAAYAICISGGSSISFREPVVPPLQPNRYLYSVREVVVNTWNGQTTGLASTNLPAGTFDVQVNMSTDLLTYSAGFYALYEARLACSVGCGTACGGEADGCGGACPTVTCGTGAACSAGACVCQSGYSSCGGACVNTSSDVNNCGACGNSCPTPGGAVRTCSSGNCGFVCKAGYYNCGDYCTGNGTLCR